ncbi:Microsomal signal peptidase 12kDa subunit [Carpediemonas membranifera]|uniref:Signal peptidase complex subunit 1 n=1 Tax=Carpediemonas membranifera TaxID=201153 RepID=A0A8J6B401_9EUKA|nr:Microsomal signal peptidase 12kDa subunit [Carpediemonas membranifera]|eukprot:KAG9392504.1 Microsomal signal peptidase 12kDa subunit [Carpediemonas membranifera]
MLDNLKKYVDFSIDYKGQRLSYWISRLIMVVALVVGLAVGYHRQDFMMTVYIILGFGAVDFVLTVLPWPMFRRMNLEWRG